MFRWLPWRRRNDGFEWREYVRTTILVRRGDRRRTAEAEFVEFRGGGGRIHSLGLVHGDPDPILQAPQLLLLQRVLRLARCFNKGWAYFASTVGATIFAHNLLVLARR